MDSIPENFNELLAEALKEHDKGCNSCYYEAFNENAYPCSRCIHNKPHEDMWQPKKGVMDESVEIRLE